MTSENREDNYKDFQNEFMVNNNNKKFLEALKYYEEAQKTSVNTPKTEYKLKKKKQPFDRFKFIIKVIAAISLTIGVSVLGTNIAIRENNAVITSKDLKNDVENIISKYDSVMNSNNSSDSRIETPVGHTSESTLVDYTIINKENLARHLTEAAKISEEEFRCALYAAFNIINNGYREDVIGDSLTMINREEELKYNIPKTPEEVLETLGYGSWLEYQLKEKNGIADLMATKDYVEGKRR